MPTTCLVCRSDAVELLLDLGDQPISNRFPQDASEDTERHAFRFGCCRNCGLAQLISPPPPSLIRPRVDWIRYNEPESHLDDLVDRLVKLDGVNPSSRVVGLTYKEDSTLERLTRRGYTNSYRYDPQRDWAVNDICAGLETFQERLTSKWARDPSRYQQADVLIARHVLEHSQDVREAAGALRALLRPGGYLVVEVPDNVRIFANREVCFLWEEHVLYFTASTLRRSLAELGFEVCWLHCYDYPVENALVCVARVSTDGIDSPAATNAIGSSNEAASFVSGFDSERQALHDQLAQFVANVGKVAVFGAGHLACKFINFYDIDDLIEFVADDHPRKQDTLLPGNRLPIRPASHLGEADIRLALLSVNPESESKVIEKYGSQFGDSLEFASLFRCSPRAFWGSI